jgi:hypothetical protein
VGLGYQKKYLISSIFYHTIFNDVTDWFIFIPASKSIYNNDCDCFVLVLSTHGLEAIDRKQSKEATVWRHQVLAENKFPIYVDEIIDIFNDENSVGLKGKPKLFFIQVHYTLGF